MYKNRKGKNLYNYGYPGQMAYGNSFNIPWNMGSGRNHPYPNYPIPQQNFDWHLYPQQNPYYPQQYQPLNQGYNSYVQQPAPYGAQPYMQKDSQFLFQNPLQPQEETFAHQNQFAPINGFPNMNPYPKPNLMLKQPGGMQSLMNSFKSQDGSIDFNKMINTAGQMMNAVNQVTSLVKGLGGMFKV